MYWFIIAVVIAVLLVLGYIIYILPDMPKKEHQMPGFGVVGQFGLRDFKTYENMYSSGSALRYQARPERDTEQNISTADFNARELNYYTHR